MTKENRFNKEVLYINILIALLFVLMLVVGYQTLQNQSDKIKTEVDNTANEFEARIQTGVGSVLYLHAAAKEIYKNRDIPLGYVSKVHEINAKGDFTLDIPALSNLTGFGGLVQSKKVLHEMASSLALTTYFTIVKGLNKSFIQVYYASKNNFSTSYPYLWSDQFMWNPSMLTKPLWQYATPELNPERNLFYTPLYQSQRKKKILLTVGHPVYDKDMFLGTVNLDIAVAMESTFLNSKNLHHGTYVIVSQEKEIIAASNLEGYDEKIIFKAKQLLSKEILESAVTDNDQISLGTQYVYVKALKSVPWKLYYIKNKLDLYVNSLYYVGMMFIVILLLFRVKTLIKRLSASRDELEHQALTDPMTKLYNRRYLSEITAHMLGLMRRHWSQLTVVMLDIDKFKNVNDTYGHQVGDDVIIKLSQTLQEFTRTSDVLFRLGGEEFLILLPETAIEGGYAMAETLRSEVEKLLIILEGGVELRFTISIGLSEVHRDDRNFDAAMTRADAALYEAKESGRNRVCRAKPVP
ncbi:MAG: diguanylate cyclase [Helicobacteraceae bacterium]|nr:diguanylate cyclase [Helicobacteraceae bacterium]